MPRKAKEEIDKKETTKSKTTTTKKVTKNPEKSTAKKSANSTVKKTSTKKTTTSKSTVKKNTKVATKITTTSSRKKVTKLDGIQKFEVLEYYDLPYRYNQTVVKVLAQTPSILFVYWDISDIDRKNFESQYGQDFFSTTKPILTIHNDDKNYSFELEINDFANSWYIHIPDSNCKYTVELGRKAIKNANNYSNYICVATSNKMDSPNNHILFENLNENTFITYKNLKTKSISSKKLGSIRQIYGISSHYPIHKLYEKFYGTQVLEDFYSNTLNNPSSGSISGVF